MNFQSRVSLERFDDHDCADGFLLKSQLKRYNETSQNEVEYVVQIYIV